MVFQPMSSQIPQGTPHGNTAGRWSSVVLHRWSLVVRRSSRSLVERLTFDL